MGNYTHDCTLRGKTFCCLALTELLCSLCNDGLIFLLLLNLFFTFRVYSKKHVKKERSRERAELAKAWNLLDPLGKGEFNLYSYVWDPVIK